MAQDPRPGDIADATGAPGEGEGSAAPPPPSLEESLRAVSDAGSASLGATVDTLRALRGLISADLAMARSAAGRGLAWTAAAVVFGATAWLLATAWIVALLERMSGLSWLSALAVATLLNLAITGLAAWRASRFFDYMGLHATRRQLSRLGLFDEHGEDVDDPAATAAPPAGEPRA
ncbi:MAG: phage holin family protein [Xanthomonadales bacterium]|nr:phage holin family protein [Xanthomonadaceae bacterium]MBN8223385.1 phage holin family protein [Xanthomonadales bacterium]